ncbi:MAG: DEAD/DEAH box helicase [Chloroflexota bacterium]
MDIGSATGGNRNPATRFVDYPETEARIDELIEGALEVCVASAFVDLGGAHRFAAFLRRVTGVHGRRVRLLLGHQFHEVALVRRQIVAELAALPGIEVRMFGDVDRRLHAKVYLFRHGEVFHAIVGSANLTGAGLGHNVEASVLMCGNTADPDVSDLLAFFERHWASARPAEEVLAEEEEMQHLPAFAPPCRVRLVSDPRRRGYIVRAGRLRAGEYLYPVVFDEGGMSEYPEDALEAVSEDDALELLRRGQFSPVAAFRQHLTGIKLAQPLVDNLYAMAASRTTFQVHQFKPVVKLLNNERRRLIVADEVGLGKTISAGLILAELASRESLARVLVLCPSSLKQKWQAEMASRFDEHFAFLDAGTVQNWRRQFRTFELHPPFLRSIASLEMLRDEANLEALSEMNLQFDLVIVDEAHHMRNSDTLSYQLGRLLSGNAAAMVLLTATPLQMGNEDLFNLLRILDEDEFPDFSAFVDLLRPNEYVNAAMRQIRPSGSDAPAALAALRRVEETTLADRFRQHPYYRRACEILAGGETLSLDEAARVRRLLVELNTLAHIFSRTRKRDVPIRWPRRDPHTIHVTLAPAELEFYNAITDFVRDLYLRVSGDARGLSFAVVMPERQVASCIPAARDRLVRMVETGTLRGEIDESGDPSDGIDEATPRRGIQLTNEEIARVRELILMLDGLGGLDTKYECLEQEMGEIFATGDVRKVLIFTFFKDTLRYLEDRLSKHYGVQTIHGDVPPEERAERLQRFEDEDRFQILLSSEVGGEGLDMQFANCMVNYDLPWNPMRVEQRIGRIDRYGQPSDKVMIFNFSVADTIETRIFHRLFERIGIFERSIGDLEAILGDQVTRLTREVLSMRLTPREEEERADRLALNLAERLVELERLEEDARRFLGQDEFFFEEVEGIRTGRRYLTAAELEHFVAETLREHFPAARLIPQRDRPGRWLLRPDATLKQYLGTFVRSARERHRTSRLPSLLERGAEIPLTFEIDVANRARELEFVTARHPLLRALLQVHREHGRPDAGVSRLVVDHSSSPGLYVVLVYLFEATGLRPGPRLAAVAVDLRSGAVSTELGQAFLTLLAEASEMGEGTMPPAEDILEPAIGTAEDEAARLRSQQERQLAQENSELVDLRLAALHEHARIKRARIELLLEEHRATLPASIVNMRRGELSRIDEEVEQKARQLEASRRTTLGMALVAAGLVEVRGKVPDAAS